MKINKKFTKITAIMMILSMCIGMTGCNFSDKGDKISIVCTIFPQYDFVRQITKDCKNIEVTMLLKPGQESHDYDPSSKDIIKIHDADVFIYVGGESDTWIKDVLSGVKNDKQIQLALMEMVDVNAEEELPGLEENHDHEEGVENSEEEHNHKEEYDEHVWTSPVNAIKITETISKALCNNIEEIDKEKIQENTDNYVKKLEKLDGEIKEVVKSATGNTIIVADRFPLLYFCKEYELKYYAAFSGCATSVEPSTATLIFLIDKVKELNTSYIFAMELSAASTAKHIAEETGAKVLTFYPCHNVTSDDLEKGITYIDLMERNKESLKMALSY